MEEQLNTPNSGKNSFKRPFPKKRLGQHFLVDRNVAGRIITAASLEPGDIIIEIGPGRGALTDILVESGVKVVAIELDRALAEELKARYSGMGCVEIISADALKVRYGDIAKRFENRLNVVANIPYNISTPLIFKFLEERDAFKTLFLMLQREVAARIVARPGTKDYGRLTIFSQLYADVRIEFNVSPKAFCPPPKVYSSLVRFEIFNRPRVPIKDISLFKKVVSTAFCMRRKTILNALKVMELPMDTIRNALADADIDTSLRAERISIDAFCRLSNLIAERISGW